MLGKSEIRVNRGYVYPSVNYFQTHPDWRDTGYAAQYHEILRNRAREYELLKYDRPQCSSESSPDSNTMVGLASISTVEFENRLPPKTHRLSFPVPHLDHAKLS